MLNVLTLYVPDSLFELDLPEGVTIEEENTQVVNLPQDITLTEAVERFDQAPYILAGHPRAGAAYQSASKGKHGTRRT